MMWVLMAMSLVDVCWSADNMPTSGSGTGFPGEPNIDKTDVSESDQMGLTSVQVPVGMEYF